MNHRVSKQTCLKDFQGETVYVFKTTVTRRLVDNGLNKGAQPEQVTLIAKEALA